MTEKVKAISVVISVTLLTLLVVILLAYIYQRASIPHDQKTLTIEQQK